MHPHPNLLVCKYMYTPHVCAWLPRVLSLLVPSSVCVGVREGEKKKEWHSEERDIAHTSDSKTSVALDERKKEPEWVRECESHIPHIYCEGRGSGGGGGGVEHLHQVARASQPAAPTLDTLPSSSSLLQPMPHLALVSFALCTPCTPHFHTCAHPTASVPAMQARDASGAAHRPPQAQESSAPHVFKHRQRTAPSSCLLPPLPPHLTRSLKQARIRASLTALGKVLGARVHMR